MSQESIKMWRKWKDWRLDEETIPSGYDSYFNIIEKNLKRVGDNIKTLIKDLSRDRDGDYKKEILELQKLYKKNFIEPASYISANSIIGIYEIGLYLQKSITLKELKERVLIRTRQYAKRQYTWQRGQMKDWKVFHDINYLDLRKKILSYLSKT